MVSRPTMLRITAHSTPHLSDPPNADAFYSTLGKFVVAWGRFEGHITAAMIQILELPDARQLKYVVPLSWKGRAQLWRKAFNNFDSLKPLQGRALAFIKKAMDEARDRNFAAHAIWDEFVASELEPMIRARTVSPRKGRTDIIDVTDYEVRLSMLKVALVVANNLNVELFEFTNFLSSLRPPPSGIRIL